MRGPENKRLHSRFHGHAQLAYQDRISLRAIQVDLEPVLGENTVTILVANFKGFQVKSTVAAAIAAILWLAAPIVAKADFRVCNDTQSLAGVALGYSVNGTWFTEGWWQIPGETCASILEGELSSKFFYIYAEDADRGGQWRGDIFMCTSNKEFKIEGVGECFERGFQKTGFFEIDTDNRDSWMVRLTEAGRSSSQN